MKGICILAFLGINTWTDIKRKQVSLAAVGVFAVGMLTERLYTGQLSWQILFPAAVGAFFLGLSMMTKGAVGIGDGLVLLALGLALDAGEFLMTVMTGMLCCGVWSGILLAVCRKGRKTEIPFVPFLLLGYMGGVWLWR